MKALLYKDLIVMKKEIIMTAVILLIYIPLTLVVGNDYLAIALIGITGGLAAMFPNYSFVHGQQGGWEGYLSATPLKQKTIVFEKFLLLFLALPLLLAGLLTAILFTEVSLSLPVCLSIIFATLIFGFVQIPLYYILGPNRARILMMLMFLALFYGTIMIVLDDRFNLSLTSEYFLVILLGVLVIAVFGAAFALSLAIYKRKEF